MCPLRAHNMSPCMIQDRLRFRLSLATCFILVILAVSSGSGCTNAVSPRAEPISALPRPLSAGEEQLVAAGNDFSLALFTQVSAAEPAGNVFISPLSASMALAMTANGAAGETLAQMRSTLRLPDAAEDELNAGYRDLRALLLGLDRSTELRIGNSIWYRQGIPFEQSFFTVSRTYFDAEVTGLDFGSAAAPSTINDWARRATAGRITEVIDRIDPQMVMFLINALYFKGVWQSPFDPQRTQQQTFRNLDGTQTSVPLMSQQGSFRALLRPEVQGVELPYGNSAFTFVALMPSDGEDVNAFVGSLTRERLDGWLGEFREGNMIVELPRFTLEYERTLNEDLQTLGMQVPFIERQADFTRMSPQGRDMYIEFVKQNTFVAVDEVGTEAAAVTTVGIGIVSLPPTFRADRPFVFLVRERFSGTILFMGKVVRLPA